MVLSYAKSILETARRVAVAFASPEIEGHVILGTPDLYAAYLLPSILALFRQAFPRIQVELRCSLSTPLVALVQRGEVDIALVTRMRDFSGGQVVRQEQLDLDDGGAIRQPPRQPGTAGAASARQHLSRLRHRGPRSAPAASGASPASARASAVCRQPCSPAWRSPSSARARWSRHARDRHQRVFSAAAEGRSSAVSGARVAHACGHERCTSIWPTISSRASSGCRGKERRARSRRSESLPDSPGQ